MKFDEAMNAPLEQIPTDRLFEAVQVIGKAKLAVRKATPGGLLDAEDKAWFRRCKHRIEELLVEEESRDKDRREKAKAARDRRHAD